MKSSHGRAQRWLLHLVRVILFVVIIALIRLQHLERQAAKRGHGTDPIELASVQLVFPDAIFVGDAALANGGREVRDAAGGELGYVVQTSPQCDHLVGFSGPTNLLLAFSTDHHIVGLTILSSGDTQEHVAQVRQNRSFLDSYIGRSWEEAARLADVDAVSGATLTSLAIQESILLRLSGGRSSLRFPDPLAIEEAKSLFATASTIQQDASNNSWWHVHDGQANQLGSILHTSPTADNLIGYQGPTETWIAVQPDGKVSGILLGRTYDNEEYVSYVRDDKYFLTVFNELSLGEIAQLDIVEAGIEGVSGATMTSTTVAEGITQASSDFQTQALAAVTRQTRQVNWGYHDLGSVAVVVAGIIVGLTKLRGNRRLRAAFQLLVIGYLGLINGDLLSQAMIAGWAQSGVPWRNAGGLFLLTAAAIIVPITTKQNLYCTQLCPHGAAQQLLRRKGGWSPKLPRVLTRFLQSIPILLLAWCIIVAMLSLPYSLIDIEPFDAWVFRVAGWATVTIAVVGLVASLFIPMAYCRFGCPTGLMLGYVRRNARSNEWSGRDWIALAFVALAFGLWLAT